MKRKIQSDFPKLTVLFVIWWCVSTIFFLTHTTTAFSQQDSSLIVIIDPGHGGNDPGNLRKNKAYLDEKDLNLKIAMQLGYYIDSLLTGVDIIYTRTSDIYVSPDQRAMIANDNNADYFISIHCNYNKTSSIRGTEVHIHNKKCKTSYEFAKVIDNQFKNRALRHSRGIKTYSDRGNHNLLVVKDTQMPAVLIECGFMSNTYEEIYLNTEYGQAIIASAIFRAFRDFSGAKSKPKKQSGEEEKQDDAEKDFTQYYRVQIMASGKPVSLESKEFNTLKMKVYEQIGTEGTPFRYKYFVGKSDTFEAAEKIRKKVIKKGFKDAFIVPPDE